MKRANVWMMLVMAGLMMISGAQNVAAQPAAAGKKTVAVVDVINVFNSVNAKKVGDGEIENLAKKLEDQRKAMIADLERMKSELTQFRPESEAGKKAMDEAMKKGLEVQNFSDYMRERLSMEQRVRTAALYRQINEAIKTYAEANGIILVLAYDKDDMSNATSPQELQSRITVRKVLYASDTLDVTRDIIQAMNAAAPIAPAP